MLAATEVVIVAMLGVIGVIMTGVVGPWVVSRSTRKATSEAKIEDWKRQDEVAARAAEAARLLLAANERVAETAAVTNGKLDVIHTLVNSNMTAAMQSEFDATTRELAMMREVIRLNKVAGTEPSVDALAAVTATEAKIAELDNQLVDRRKQTAVAELQQQVIILPSQPATHQAPPP
jgi:hypothetical protein